MATTPNYSFSVYSSTDTDVRFLDFRVATAGSQSTSNFYVIDTVLKQHSDAIDSINATPSAFVVKGTYSSGSLYTASVANYPGYKNEQLIVLSLNQKNTGAVQININGTTNKDVMKYGSDGVLKAVEAGDFIANSPVLCLYDGTRFVVIGITSASSITATGEAGDILQIAENGTIESSGKKAAQPNGIATLDENGNVVQVANMANSAAAVYSGEPVTIEYADENRIGSVTAYGNNSQTSGTTTAPISMNGVDSVQVSGNNLFLNNAETETKSGITFTVNPDKSVTVNGTNSTSASAVHYTGYNVSLPAGSYTLSGTSSLIGGAEIEIKIKRVSGAIEWFSINNSLHTRTFNIATGDIIDTFYVLVRAGQTADNVTVYPMLNVGSTALPYEPYNGNITQLPIPRELHRIGEAADKCITRVKSVYDKRIVLDGAEDWKMGGAVGDGAPYIFCDLLNDHYQAFPIISSRFPSTNILASNKNQGIGCWDRSLYLRYDSLFTNVEELKTYLSAHPLTVYYQSTAYDGTNGLDVCLMKYQTGFVELDGTENWVQGTGANAGYLEAQVLKNTNESHLAVSSIAPFKYQFAGNCVFVTNNKVTFGSALGSAYTVDTWKAYLAAQKAAGTPVQVAYHLATPEVYATDPVDFDNTAGPLTVMTGGELEVRMTELVGTRSDVSNNTVAFTETAQDADIASGEKLSVLFGKIKKRFSVVNKLVNGAVYPNLGTNTNFSNPINQRGAASYTTATEAHMYCIDRWRILKNTTYTVASFTLTATSYAARACGMWQSNEMGAHQLSIGDDVTVSIYVNGKLHTPTMKVIDRDLYDAFTNVPAGYDCDDFEIVLCTYAQDTTKYNLGIYPKKPLTVNYIKWEKGSIATPYVPKGYGAELVECYRYFWISSMPVNIFKTTAGDYFRNTVYFPIAMRTVPSVTILSSNGTVSISAVTIDAVKFAGNGGNDTVTSFSASADL